MSKSLEERALAWARKQITSSLSESCNEIVLTRYVNLYMSVAQEQREADVERGCQWLHQTLNEPAKELEFKEFLENC